MIRSIHVHGYEFTAQTEDRMSQHEQAANRALDYIAEALNKLSAAEAAHLHANARVEPTSTPEQLELDRIADKATARAFDELEYHRHPMGACMSLHAERDE